MLSHRPLFIGGVQGGSYAGRPAAAPARTYLASCCQLRGDHNRVVPGEKGKPGWGEVGWDSKLAVV